MLVIAVGCIPLPYDTVPARPYLHQPVLRVILIPMIERIPIPRLIVHPVDLPADQVVVVADLFILVRHPRPHRTHAYIILQQGVYIPMNIVGVIAVSYTHLTLPTIYSV